MAVVSIDRIPSIQKGPGALEGIGAAISGLTGSAVPVLLLADPGLKAAALIDAAVAAITSAGHSAHVFSDIKSDPSMAQVDAAATAARAAGARAVVSLGGGSAMDAGKTVAAIAASTAPASDYGLCANPFPAGRLASICVPTTSGTGSETTRVSVLSDADHNKVWLWGAELKPDLVILDPVLTTGLPGPLTAATGIDALIHAAEAATNRNANSANDVFCLEAIRLVSKHLARAVSHPGDLEARGALQWAACLAGIGIDNAGTAIAHNIGHALASLRPIHHGRAVGLAMLATLEWNASGADNGRWALVAEAMGAARSADAAAPAYAALLRSVPVKVSLAGEGFDDVSAAALAAQMARPENAAMRNSNARASSDADLLAFAETMISQV